MDDSGLWLDALYRDTGPRLLMYLGRRIGDAATAEDLLQETFAAALREPDRLRSAGSPIAYLFGIARHLAATAARRQRPTEPLPDELPAEPAEPDAQLEQMREAIRELKPEFRDVIELRLLHELSYAETAQVLDIPVGTVRSRLHHAVIQLRRTLQQSMRYKEDL
jgi:RNA polymerase sigma-70 factor, ECF subfamily